MLAEVVGALACFVLAVFAMPLATVLGNRGMWAHRISLFAVEGGLCLVAVNPWTRWSDPVPWSCSALFVFAAIMVSIWWREAWAFVVAQYGPASVLSLRRRAMDIPASQYRHIGGGRGE